MKKIVIAVLATLALTGQAVAGHNAAVGQGSCSYCHKVNLIDQHGGFAAGVCTTCHKSSAVNVVTTIAAGAAGQQYACSNCHGGTSHLSKHGSYMTAYNTSVGYQPNASAIWVQPASYTEVNPAAKQYQLCYKCHSSKALGTVAGGVSGIVGPSGDNFTDQAMEFNPANKSAHPVQVAANSFTGSPAPKALATSQVNATWSKVGTQTMQCSDCHIAGSTEKFMLIAGTTWPKKADGKYWALGDLNSSTSGWQTKLFCAKCHPMKSGSSFLNNVHGEGDHQSSYSVAGSSYSGAPCVSCHVVVPHGAKRSRLIGYASDVKPYAAYGTNGTTMSLMKGFKKATSPTSYSESNCWSSAGACSDHNSSSGTWEP